MKKQSYSNHVRFYVPHHFVFYPLALIILVLTIRGAVIYPDQRAEWLIITAILVLLMWTSFMMRQHYGLTTQNRIVRLELRFRYFALTGKRLEPMEAHLRFGQMAALRFASDEELPGLVDRAIAEQLSPDAIKRAVKDWQADHMRV